MFTGNIVGQIREFELNISDWNTYKAQLQNNFNPNELTDEIKKENRYY